MTRAEMRRLLAEASPRPWEARKDERAIRVISGAYLVAQPYTTGGGVWQQVANADLIAAAVNALPVHLDALDAAEAELCALRERLNEMVTEDAVHDDGEYVNEDAAVLLAGVERALAKLREVAP